MRRKLVKKNDGEVVYYESEYENSDSMSENECSENNEYQNPQNTETESDYVDESESESEHSDDDFVFYTKNDECIDENLQNTLNVLNKIISENPNLKLLRIYEVIKQ